MRITTVPSIDANKSLLISFLTLRRTIGYLGIGLPLILVAGSVVMANCWQVQPSISAYYHTVMRDVFVAIISMIAIFLFTYKGYDQYDKVSCKLASIFAMGVALFPTGIEELEACAVNYELAASNRLIGQLHLFFACCFFLTISYISIGLFTKSNSKTLSITKQRRNRIYRLSGYLIIACLIAIAIYWWVILDMFPGSKDLRLVFFLEAIALIAFGISWLIKGQFILKDRVEISSIGN
ncbi:MAG: DUF998 domain-containing protein [Saprospiraceae bacterium]|nr:DUF998 domain-containing protein [Saprospiraceae bacterium]